MRVVYNRILVISDNPTLCVEFQKIFNQLDIVDAKLQFAISPFSDPAEFFVKNLQVVDMKLDSDIERIINDYNIVFSIHCKQIFPEKLVSSVKCINAHPGLNPYNRGWYPQVFAIIHDLPIGATIHEIDNKLDHGNIIAQKEIEKYDFDTSLTLYNRVVLAEIELLRSNLLSILSNTYNSQSPVDEGNLFLKSDFNELLELDPCKKQSIRETLDILRALTHGEFKNIYVRDSRTNKKIYLKLTLTPSDDE